MTNKKYFLYSIISLFLFLGCSSGVFNTLKYTFDNSTGGAKFYQNAGKNWSINHEDKVTRDGEGSVRFELRPEDTWWDGHKNSHRTEMRFSESYSGWYGFSMFIPDDGSTIGSKTYIGQWHAGGKGSAVRGSGKAPAISQCFVGSSNYNDILAITVYSNSGLQYMEMIPHFPRGVWVDFIYEIKFSSGKKGILNVWMNGKQVVKYKGPTTYRGAVHMFKFGIYTLRPNEINKPVIVYFDEYCYGTTYESVDPSKGELQRIDM